MKLRFQLTRAAPYKGGDRYECFFNKEDQPIIIYIPQQLSRKNDTIAEFVDVTIEADFESHSN